MDASRRRSAIIASAGEELDENGYFSATASALEAIFPSGEVDSDDVTHMDASRKQIIGTSAGLIPFIEKNYVYEVLMGSNQQRQAVPLVQPKSPIVGTGLEADAAKTPGNWLLQKTKAKLYQLEPMK